MVLLVLLFTDDTDDAILNSICVRYGISSDMTSGAIRSDVYVETTLGIVLHWKSRPVRG